MRVIREYAMNYSRTYGGYFVHSSAFAYDDKGIIIAGPENSGKTSLLIYFLQHLPSQLISNDRVLVCFNESATIIYSMPTVITVAEDSLEMFPQLKMNLLRYNFHHRYTINEILARKCRPYRLEQGEYTVSAGQFCKLLEVKSSSGFNLSAILFPHITKKTGSICLEKLPEVIVLKRLKEAQFAKDVLESQSVFYLNDSNHNSFRDEFSYDDFAHKLASQIPCFDCYLGFQAYKNNNVQEVIKNIFTGCVARM